MKEMIPANRIIRSQVTILFGCFVKAFYYNDTWRSTDKGGTWTRISANGGWTGRFAHTSVTLPDGSVVLMGGYNNTDGYKNDVWRSSNGGYTWTYVGQGPENSPLQAPLHTYTKPGNYSVSLKVSNSSGSSRMVRIGYISAGEPAHCGYNSCDEINNQTDYDECVTCTQTYCEGLCANSSCDLTEDQVTFIVGNYTCSYGNWLPASCGQNALLNWALEGDTAQFKDVLSTARWRRTIDCPNMGHSYAFENPGGKNVKMAGVTAKDIGFFHEIAAELPAGKDGDDYSSWRFFNYGESNIIKGVGFPGIPSGQIPAGGTTCYTKVTIRNILGIHDCLVIDDPPNIVETFYIDQNLQIQPNQKSGCGELAMLKSLLPNRNSQKNYKDLPYELKTVLKTVKFSHKFATSRWEIDTVNRSMTIYTYGIRDEQEMNSFDGRTVNNYTIRMVHDSEFEITVQDVKNT